MRALLMTLLLSLTTLAPAWAQDDEPAPTPEMDQEAMRKAERAAEVEMKMAPYRNLGLSDEQLTKIRGVFEAEIAGREEAAAAQQAAIDSVLTPEQRAARDKAEAAGQGEGVMVIETEDENGNRVRRVQMVQPGKDGKLLEELGVPSGVLKMISKPRKGSARLARMGMDTARFKRELKLSEEQAKAFEEALAPAVRRLDDAEKKSAGKPWDYATWRAFALQLRKEFRPKLSALLTDAQRQRFEALNASWDDKVESIYERWKTGKGEFGRLQRMLDEAKGARKAAPGERARGLLEQVIKALGVEAEEAAALKPMLKALIDHKLVEGARLAARRGQLARAGAEAEAKVAAYRAARQRWSDKLASLQGELRELLTIEQEALLISHDLLP